MFFGKVLSFSVLAIALLGAASKAPAQIAVGVNIGVGARMPLRLL